MHSKYPDGRGSRRARTKESSLHVASCMGIAAACLSLANWADARPSAAPSPVVGLGVGAYSDSGEKQESLTLGGAPETTRTDFRNDGLFSLGAWMLWPVADKLRVGAGARWYGGYGTREPEAESDAEPFRYGTMLQSYGQGEYILAVGKSDLVFGAQLGLLTIIAGSDFKREIDSDAQAGWSNTGLPRLGAFAGPLVGLVYPATKGLDLRGDLGLQFARAWLLDSPGADNDAFNKNQQLGFTRILLTLGAEVSL